MTARPGRQPVEIDAHPGLPRDDNGAAEGFDGAVAPDGTLYAIWSQDNEIMFTGSRNGGKSFSRARAVIHTAPIMFAIETLDRANGFPQIAVDPKRGANLRDLERLSQRGSGCFCFQFGGSRQALDSSHEGEQ